MNTIRISLEKIFVWSDEERGKKIEIAVTIEKKQGVQRGEVSQLI